MVFFETRTGDSRGFAFVRYKYQDEAQKAVEKLDGELGGKRKIVSIIVILPFVNIMS